MAERVSAQRVAELTSALVAIPSYSDESAVQHLLARTLSSAGFSCDMHEVAPGRSNLLAVRGADGPFVCSHADTHPPHGHPDPYTSREEDGTLVGRGVLDAKGQIAALVAAAEVTGDAPATILITCDEEAGGAGSEHLQLPDRLRPSGGGIVLEPTGFTVCVTQSGCIDLAIDTTGSPAHAHARDGGVSALDVLTGALDALDGCSFMDIRHPLLPPPRRHVGCIEAGEHLWRVPARASARAALTLVPGADPHTARSEVDEVLGALALAWAGRGAEVRHEILDVCEPLEVPSDLPIVERLHRSAGAPLEIGGMPSWTDAANLCVHHGIDCVVFGAGDLTSAHSDREHVPLDDLVRLAQILCELFEDGAATRG